MEEPKYKIGDIILAYNRGFLNAIFGIGRPKKFVFKIGYIDIYRDGGICYRRNAWVTGVFEYNVIKKIN